MIRAVQTTTITNMRRSSKWILWRKASVATSLRTCTLASTWTATHAVSTRRTVVSPEPRPNSALGQVDPETLTFDKERQLLVVSGSFSGTLGLYKVKGLPTCNATAPTKNVRMVVVLPYTAAEFTESLQNKFIRAVAFTTSIDASATLCRRPRWQSRCIRRRQTLCTMQWCPA